MRGVNTAATIWCAAAASSLAGAGFYSYAFGGAAAVLGANVALRRLGRLIDHQPGSAEAATTYDLRAVTRSEQKAHIRSLIVPPAFGERLMLRGVHSEHLEGGDLVVRQVTAAQRHELGVKAVPRSGPATCSAWNRDSRTEHS